MEIYEVLGIEAARAAFLNEFKEVLSPYGIKISIHHLSILADWICTRGYLTSIGRVGFGQAKDISVLRKASYEMTEGILLKAAVCSETDELKGVTEQVIFGRHIESGTSQCTVHVDPSKTGKFSLMP